MARLGELLVAARLLDQEQVDRALRAQVLWGGRLGTNLIELGLLDLDGISRALGRQHRIPAALARHFDKADRALQERLDPEIARRLSVVPLLHVGPQKQIAIAVLDPLSADELAELADALSCTPDGIVMSIAAEMRMRYHLERVYGISRQTRFLRSKGKTVTPFPQFDNVPVPVDSDVEMAVPIEVDEAAHPTGRASVTIIEVDTPRSTPSRAREQAPPAADDLEGLAALIDDAIAQAAEREASGPTGRERRTYVRTLADEIDAPAPDLPAPASVVTGSAAPQAIETAQTAPASLGRIAIKRVAAMDAKPSASAQSASTGTNASASTSTSASSATNASASTSTSAPSAPTAAAPKSFIEATRAIRRATHRDRVAELVIETLQRFVPSCEAAVLLVVRGAVAISWKQFSRVWATHADIAVPLDQPGLVPTVIERNEIARCSAAELGPIDEALLRAIGELRGDLAVVPIAIADRVMCLIAVASEANARIDAIEGIGIAAGTAFARLIRDASR